MKPFITSNPEDARVLFENFGLAFYYAQLLEDDLKLILIAAEAQGLVHFDRKKDLHVKGDDDGLLQACLGALKEVIKKNRHSGDGDEFYDTLDKANKARRLLAHRFFLLHAVDLLSEAGRAAVNQHLSELYVTIRQAHTMSSYLRVELYAKVGFTAEDARKKLDELLGIIGEPLPDKNDTQ
jgi:hypothetical protein